jgi:hypothetical protein
VFTLVLGSLSCRKDDWKHLALVTTRMIVNGEVLRKKTSECRQEGAVETLNKTIADADGVLLLGGKWSCCIEHLLVVLNDAGCHGLTTSANRCLTDVFEEGAGLIAVPQTELDEDQCADLF